MEHSVYYNEYIISSNNSINENTINNQKFKRSPSYRLKKLLKPLINIIKQSSGEKPLGTQKLTTTKTVCKCRNYSYDYEDEYIYNYTSEIDNNQFNEELETRIIDEIKHCDDNSAIYVYDEEDHCNVMPVNSEEIYIPVHFARTEGGTFFWTSTQRYDSDLIEPKDCDTKRQLPSQQQHSHDRWVQA